MIGVIADPTDHDVAREFFELFKTPWEFWRDGRAYDVVVSAGEVRAGVSARLLIVYAGHRLAFDGAESLSFPGQAEHGTLLVYEGMTLPIYGNTIGFPDRKNSALMDQGSASCVLYSDSREDGIIARLGYDLFKEVRHLLTIGQPSANASYPALELHISLLRDLINTTGISLVEIPPVPDGYSFIACLTHDVDHPSIRRHRFDHTVLGFLYRAVITSTASLLRRKIPMRALLRNWVAAARLPFVQIGLAQDFWYDFGEKYRAIEKDLPSTFFVIPFEGRPGITAVGAAPSLRAARYGAKDIATEIKKLVDSGCEVGVHGIDAWIDSSKGQEELSEIKQVAGATAGIRMHWLYFNEQSPIALEEAGAEYDSTVGYNDTVGYRAGTTQVYKHLQAKQLLELPLHAMDTALFYPSYLDLSSSDAMQRVSKMIENADKFGGCFTVNWHDRSLAPERNWDSCYRELIKELKDRGAWITTAGQAVAWFRMRRSVTFSDVDNETAIETSIERACGNELPKLSLRRHGTIIRGDGVRFRKYFETEGRSLQR